MTQTAPHFDEYELLQVERDSAISLLRDREAFTTHLETLLDHARAERDDVYREFLQSQAEQVAMQNRVTYLEGQLVRLERVRSIYRGLPGGNAVVRTLRRLLR